MTSVVTLKTAQPRREWVGTRYALLN